MTDVVGNPEEERRAEFYFQPWAQEAVCRYFYSKVSIPEQGSPSVPSGSEYLSLLGNRRCQWKAGVLNFTCRHC